MHAQLIELHLSGIMNVNDPKDLASIDNTMVPCVGRTMKFMDGFVNMKLKEFGIELSRKQFVILKILRSGGPLPQNDLAFITDRDKASLTRFINTLEKKNLVARIPSSEDKRINLIHLTKQGEKMMEDTWPRIRQLIEKMQEGISPEEQRIVIDVLNRVQENIQKQHNS